MNLISVVIPCYNENDALPYFDKEMKKTSDYISEKYHIGFEFIFVDDGSKDGTINCLRSFNKKDARAKYISFSRNFGKEAAIYAGLQHSNGDYVVLMDADLQHPPKMLEDMYLALKDNEYDVVAARRISRQGEPIIRSWFAKLFYRVINKISNAEFVDGASDFRMLSRKAVDAILQMCEYNRFSKGIFGWIGFKTKWLPYENVERIAGKTKWSFWKLLLYSIEGIIGFSTIPLSIASLVGMIFCLVAILYMFFIIIRTLIWGDPVAGYPTLVCLLLFIGGSLQLSLGIIGQYLAKTYLETKHRPIYIIEESNLKNCFDLEEKK